MSQAIKDGTGTGKLAKVDDNNRLSTVAVTKTQVADVSESEGKAFAVASNYITLSDTSDFNGFLYIKNTSAEDCYIKSVRISTTEPGFLQCKLIRNPATGTLITDAYDANANPLNFGSEEVFSGDAYTASGDSKTILDGDHLTQFTLPSPGVSLQDYEGTLILPKNKSIALMVKPSATTTVGAEIRCWFE